ncbi:MAG TPA: Flp family type IVb pilin [Myxococcota bacterium]|nr:Flp family type IVb pilin [Myxococcota bacterium]
MAQANKVVSVARASVLQFFRDEEGATAAEYGIIAALIAVVIIAAVKTLGTNMSSMFNRIAGEVK